MVRLLFFPVWFITIFSLLQPKICYAGGERGKKCCQEELHEGIGGDWTKDAKYAKKDAKYAKMKKCEEKIDTCQKCCCQTRTFVEAKIIIQKHMERFFSPTHESMDGFSIFRIYHPPK